MARPDTFVSILWPRIYIRHVAVAIIWIAGSGHWADRVYEDVGDDFAFLFSYPVNPIACLKATLQFGIAMDKTGAAEFLANWVVSGLGPFGVTAVLGGLFILTILLTQPMSNAAAALVVLPIAIETAQKLGANERTFAIAIMLAASI